jgi:hypothetical protein
MREEPPTVGVNFTEHVLKDLCFERLQGALENVPALLLDQATLPVGAEPEPTTVVLQVIFAPTTTEAWLQDTERIVEESARDGGSMMYT